MDIALQHRAVHCRDHFRRVFPDRADHFGRIFRFIDQIARIDSYQYRIGKRTRSTLPPYGDQHLGSH